jgi:hypothetical protein
MNEGKKMQNAESKMREIGVVGRPEVGTIFFDRLDCEQAVAFYPYRPDSGTSQRWLWWTGAVSPEVIDAVWELLCRRPELVNTIVIGGLGGYPLCMSQWTTWLARWGSRAGRCRLIVDTRGLSPRQRRRLVAQTHRKFMQVCTDDPFSQAVATVKYWIKEKLR